MDAYRHAVELDPSNVDLRNNLGMMLVNTRHAEAGIAQFEKVLSIAPSNNTARLNIGFAHLEKRELDQAIAAFRR